MRAIILGLALAFTAGPVAGAAPVAERPADRCPPPPEPRHTLAGASAFRSCPSEPSLRCGCRVEP